MIIDGSSNVGIGTTSPSEKLAVIGNIDSTSTGTKIGFNVSDSFTAYSANTAHYGMSYARDSNPLKLSGYFGLSLYTNGTERVTIAQGGNVGIGSTSPAYKLDVNGTGRFQDNLFIKTTSNYGSLNIIGYDNSGINIIDQRTAGSGEFYSSITFRDYYLSNSAAINFYHNQYFGSGVNRLGFSFLGSEKLSILYGGNVGIGTTAPNTKLHVNGGAANSEIRITSADGYKSRFGMYEDEAGSTWGAWVQYNGAGDNLEFGHKRSGTDSSPEMVINLSGNVGIGTTSPQVKFSVQGSQNNTIAPANAVSKFVGGDAGVFIGNLAGTPNYGAWLQAMRESDGLTFPLHLQPNGGNVGIGTTSPLQKLHVIGNIWAEGNIGFYTSGGAGLTFADRSGNDLRIYTPSGAIKFVDATGLSNFATITSGGNVGIGTTSPAYKLDVSGDIRATGDVIAYSDARVKDNVQTVENALEKVTSLRGVTYTRKDNEDKSRKVGVIAQEVLPILPEVVQQDDNGNYSVAYGNMVGVLIEAIKEQQQQIDELKYLLQTINK
jgi:hypothetical protein